MTTKPVDFSVLLSSLLHMDLLPDWMRTCHQHTSQNTSFRVTLEHLAQDGCQTIPSQRQHHTSVSVKEG